MYAHSVSIRHLSGFTDNLHARYPPNEAKPASEVKDMEHFCRLHAKIGHSPDTIKRFLMWSVQRLETCLRPSVRWHSGRAYGSFPRHHFSDHNQAGFTCLFLVWWVGFGAPFSSSFLANLFFFPIFLSSPLFSFSTLHFHFFAFSRFSFEKKKKLVGSVKWWRTIGF